MTTSTQLLISQDALCASTSQIILLRSSSVHRRHELGPLGDTANKKVRMSNLIVQNICTLCRLLFRMGRQFYLVLEQPSSSVLWRLDWVLTLGAILACTKITTWSRGWNYIKILWLGIAACCVLTGCYNVQLQSTHCFSQDGILWPQLVEALASLWQLAQLEQNGQKDACPGQTQIQEEIGPSALMKVLFDS